MFMEVNKRFVCMKQNKFLSKKLKLLFCWLANEKYLPPLNACSMKMNFNLLDIQQYWHIHVLRLQKWYIILWILWNINIDQFLKFFFSCSEIDSCQRSVQQTASRFYRHHLQKLASSGRFTWSYIKYFHRQCHTLSQIHVHIY